MRKSTQRSKKGFGRSKGYSAPTSTPKNDAQLNAINSLFLKRNLRAAEIKAVAYVRAYPGHLNGWLAYIKILGGLRKQAESLKVASEMVIRFQDAAIAHMHKGLVCYRYKLIDDAERSYQTAIGIEPALAEAHYNYGVLLSSADRLEEAVERYEHSISLRPDFLQSHFNHANALKRLNKLEQAVVSYKRALEIEPKYFDALCNLGICLKEAERYPESVKAFETALSIRSDEINIKLELGEVLRLKKDLLESKKILSQTAADHPDNTECMLRLGNTLDDLGQLEEAKNSYLKVLDIEKNNGGAWYNLANIERKLGDLNASIRSYHKAIAADKAFFQAHNNLGIVLEEAGNLSESVKSYNRAISVNPTFAPAYFNLANALKKTGSYRDSINSYLKSIELSPHDTDSYINLGLLLLELNRVDEAINCFQKALACEPLSYKSLINLANAYVAHGSVQEGKNLLRKAMKTSPKSVLAYENLGLILENQSLPHEARNTYHEMLANTTSVSDRIGNAEVITLMPFGRSASLFVHSLIDGHEEIDTIPGIYLKSWFREDYWERLYLPESADWRQNLIQNLLKEYEPLFDASSRKNVPGKPMGETDWLAAAQGFAFMGDNGNEPLKLDLELFKSALLGRLQTIDKIQIHEFFELIHELFSQVFCSNRAAAVHRDQKILFHIHNPTGIERANFLRFYPNSRELCVIRNPIQSLESWMLQAQYHQSAVSAKNPEEETVLRLQAWKKQISRATSMLAQIHSPFHNDKNRGIRLEDIKRNNNTTMPALAAWLGIRNAKSLHESTFCGLKYWGPSSKNTGRITGFDTRAIDRQIGKVFSQRDIYILETFFWPVRFRYSYTEMNHKEYVDRMTEIRPWLDEPLDFERQIYNSLPIKNGSIKSYSQYNILHASLTDYWNVFHLDGELEGVVKPLELTASTEIK